MAIGNILDEILTERHARTRLCALGRWLNGLDESDQAKVEDALWARENDKFVVLHTELANYLGRLGLNTNEYMVGEHRRGTCACRKSA